MWRDTLRPYKYPVPYQTFPAQPDLTSIDDSCPNNYRVVKLVTFQIYHFLHIYQLALRYKKEPFILPEIN